MELHIINVTLNGKTLAGMDETYTVALITTGKIDLNMQFANDEGVFSPKKFKEAFKVARIRWATNELARHAMTTEYIDGCKKRVKDEVKYVMQDFVCTMYDLGEEQQIEGAESPLVEAVCKYLTLFFIPDEQKRMTVYARGFSHDERIKYNIGEKLMIAERDANTAVEA
jgi:hypothetical protein